MTNYDHETEFRAYTCEETSRLVNVYVTFNIDTDDMEILEFSRFVFKKCYSIELGNITARDVETGVEYIPTKDDLIDWKRDIQNALQKEFSRQTA